MDPQRELAVLKYVSILWRRNVTDVLDLQDGHFFLHVLDLLDHGNKDRMNTYTDESRLLFVKEFLKDFYGDSVRLDDYLHFKIILSRQTSSLAEIKLELAKIAVVLFGIGVLDRNGKVFMDAALQLSAELQNDILAMIQSVVLPDSTEVVLTHRIEHVLLAADLCSPPVLNMLTTDSHSSSRTPRRKSAHRADTYDGCTPLRHGGSVFSSSFHDVSSPFKYLDIKSPSSPLFSPLVDFVQSPQLIQKAVLKQKDLELRKLQEQLSAETLLKEEAQYSLRECQSVRVSQDFEISKLQKRILEFDGIQESHSELLELHKKHDSVTAELLSIKATVQDLLLQKEILEKENFTQTEDISEMHRKIKSLETESLKHKSLLETVQQLELDNKSQEVQLIYLRKSQTQWEEDKAAYNRNLKTAREMNKRLQTELEELQAKKNDVVNNTSVVGETMDIVVDIQMGELRCQLKEATDVKDVLEKQLESRKREISHLREQIEHGNQQLTQTKETNANLCHALRIERDTIDKMKKRMESIESKYEDTKMKLESSLKEKENSAVELSTLRRAMDESEQQLQKYQQQLQSLSHFSSQLSRDKEDSSPVSQKEQNSSCDSFHATARLSSGYESSSICSPGESDPGSKDLVFSRNNGGRYKFINDNMSMESSMFSVQNMRTSTASLPSMQSLNEHLSCLLPDASSCANEPDADNNEWSRLGGRSPDAGQKDIPRLSSIRDCAGSGLVKSTVVSSPLKREIRDVTNCASPPKQKKSGGTVKYFPLDPNGPIYPPPQPSTHPRRFSGRFIPTLQTTSSATLQTRSKCSTSYPSIAASTAPMNICDTRELPENNKHKPAVSPQKKSVASRRPSYRFYHMYKYSVSKKASHK